MRSLRKHIHRLYIIRPVGYLSVPLCEQLQIPGQRRRVTADVHNPLRSHPENSLNQGRGAALAGRVKYDYVRRRTGHPGSKFAGNDQVFSSPGLKVNIADAVPFGIFTRIPHSIRYDFHTIDSTRLFCKIEGNRPDPAIQVIYGFISGQRSELQYF